METEPTCLSERALTLLVWGRATGNQADEAMSHIDLCKACRDAFERMAGASIQSGALPPAVPSSSGRHRTASGWVASPAWAPPSQIDEFLPIRRLGRGAMGDVWLARDTLLERDVALKFAADAANDEARLRFRVEARAIARLQHPNILAVHHAGELADRPFLVTELLSGTSMDRMDKLPADRVIAIGADLARALAAAHAAGVIHRDVKPANAFLCDDGVAKLLDFGLAQLRDAPRTAHPSDSALAADRPEGASAAMLDGRGDGIAGTPAYMAPETWRGETASRPTDVYSLGALLFALLADRPPYGGQSIHELRALVLQGHLPDLSAAAPEAPAPLVALVEGCLSLAPAARPSAEGACNALQAMIDSDLDAAASDGQGDLGANPYRGLLSFGFEQRGLFFGREVETAAVVTQLHGAPFVLVVGPSGCGKSSLVSAGVLPHLVRRDSWRTATMVPGDRPIERFAQALSPLLDAAAQDIASQVTASPGWVAERISKEIGAPGLLIFVDQFEEAWTLADERQRATLFDALAALSRVGPKVRVIAALRADFLSKVKELGELRTLRAAVVLGAMSSEGLRRAIVEPARRRGVRVEPELVDRLVEAARGESGILPLLGFALEALWEKRDRTAGCITGTHLDALGGLEGALAVHADAALARLAPGLRTEARRLLLALVTVERTRARREERDLVADSPEARSALHELVDARLVVASAGEETTAYEVAHEVLLSGWSALRGWLDEEASVREALERVRRGAAEWERLGRSAQVLLGEHPLAELDVLQGLALPPKAASFVAASRSAVRRARLRRTALAASIPLTVVAAAAMGWAVSHARHRQALLHAIAEARGLDRSALGAAAEADKARAEALALFDKDDLGPAEDRWKQMLALEEDTDRQRREVGAALDKALALEPRDPVALARCADVTLARLLAAERLHEGALLRELRARLDIYDDGSRAAWLRAPAHVRVETEPAGATLTLARYRQDAVGRLVESDLQTLANSDRRELEPGSYLILAKAPDRYTTRYPFLVRRGEESVLRVVLPRAADVPEGMVYVPAGRSLYGSGDDENTRGFLTHQPLHDVDVGAFLIARTEVTYGDYIPFVLALPALERRERLPVGLELTRDGSISFVLRKTTLAPGEPYCNGVQPCVDWLRLPVDGAGREDGERFATWLSSSGRLPGARLCTDREWERAARGADDRLYPSGNGEPGPDEACSLATYGGDAHRAGPCAVGTHPASRTPFGIDDMAGSEWEWTSGPADVAQPKQGVIRGAAWNSDGAYMSIPNRGLAPTGVRYPNQGLRLCAPARSADG